MLILKEYCLLLCGEHKRLTHVRSHRYHRENPNHLSRSWSSDHTGGQTGRFQFKDSDCLWKKGMQILKEYRLLLCVEHKSFTHVYRRRVIVKIEHKPLEAIFRKPVNEAPPRLRGHCWDSPSMTFMYAMYQEKSRSFQTVLAKHHSVKLNQSVNWKM